MDDKQIYLLDEYIYIKVSCPDWPKPKHINPNLTSYLELIFYEESICSCMDIIDSNELLFR